MSGTVLEHTTIPNALSVDVEEWFHVCRAERFVPRRSWDRLEPRVVPATERLLRLFEARGARATFFVLGYVADRHPDLVRRIEDAGHEVALHGYWHERVDDLGPRRFEEDLRKGLEAVGRRGRAAVRGFRAPEWSITARTPWAYEILAAHGLRYDSSLLPFRIGLGNGLRRWPHRVGTARGEVWEFPVSTLSWAGGHWPFTDGTALRLLSAEFVGRGIRRLNRSGIPVNLSLHPWEVDPGAPTARFPLLRGALHTMRLASTAPKLDRLLAEFRFGTLGEVLEGLGACAQVVTDSGRFPPSAVSQRRKGEMPQKWGHLRGLEPLQ